MKRRENEHGTVKEKRKKRKKAWQKLKNDLKPSRDTVDIRASLSEDVSKSLQCNALDKIREITNPLEIAGTNKHGFTALHICAMFGHVALVQYLLSMHCISIGIDVKSKQGSTAFDYACMGEHAEICYLLLQQGAHGSNDELEKRGERIIQQRQRDAARIASKANSMKMVQDDLELIRNANLDIPKLRNLYDAKWETFRPRQATCMADIPWPPGPKQNVFCLSESLETKIQYLRKDRLRWHPDRFQHLAVKDEACFEKVVMLAQCINETLSIITKP